MPIRPETQPVLVDTSVAVALVVADHVSHEATVDALRGRVLGLSGHAVFETYSVLTRLPSPNRRSPEAIEQLLCRNFPATRHLTDATTATLLEEFSNCGITGASIYDALVGATARAHDALLMTRNRRATDTYRTLGVAIEVLAADDH